MNAQAPRGILNNNPGNIRKSRDLWQGLAKQQTDAAFFVFQSPAYGIRALARILINYQDKYRLKTIDDIINRWAPPVENNTLAYVASVVKASGFSANQVLNMGTYEGVLQTMLHIAGRGDVLGMDEQNAATSLNALRQAFYGDRFVTLNVVVNAKSAANLNQRQLWFLGELQQERIARVDDIMRVWGVCLRTARRDLKGLAEHKMIYFSGGKRSGRYRLI